MIKLYTVALSAILALPVGLSAQTQTSTPPASRPEELGAPPPSPSRAASTPSVPQDKHEAKRTKKVKKAKKNNCNPGPSYPGMPDYCKNPYWDPKDWDYIYANSAHF